MIFLGSDHRGYPLKESIKKYLKEKKVEFIDCGTYSEESTDYPSFAKKVSKYVQKDKNNRGILICGTGIGMCIVANKFRGVRCALCSNIETTKYSRLHNNSNILALSANEINKEQVAELLDIWLNTDFEGERHQRRIDIIEEIEKENLK